MAELTPYPLASLATRMFRELAEHDAIFGLPTSKFFRGDAAKDLSVRFHGRTAASPLGPAAGPHTQMAHNIVLSWLGGSRILELKTVQILDELEIPRPCIDMQTVGFNAEWSQELKLEQSLEEYVKAAMLIEMLAASGRLAFEGGFETGLADTVFDISVGYDLAGIRSDRVQAFLRGMKNAEETVERLRRQLPRSLGRLRDLDFTTGLSRTVTLSTFHGCPPDEIERIIEFLMESHGLDCVIKFNPTLLGRDRVRELLHGTLGYESLQVPDSAFDQDTTWQQAVAMMRRLGEKAQGLGLSLGAKFSNTLIVDDHRGFIPASEEQVYLSGQPLHVLAMNLVRRFRRHFGDLFPISFAAGIDRRNFADAAALGLVPITICSDLLRPGGYARLHAAGQELSKRMDAVSAGSIEDWILRAYGHAQEALEQAVSDAERSRLDACREALRDGGDWRRAAGEKLAKRWLLEAIRLNTESYVERATLDPRYAAARNAKPPRKIGSHLELFDCITCDKCVPVCPNHANFTFKPDVDSIPVVRLNRAEDGWQARQHDDMVLTQRHQIGTFHDFCNECGNCDVFCPEDGGPYVIKPRFFGSEESLRAQDGDGFHLRREGEIDIVLGRMEGRDYRLQVAGDRIEFSADGFAVSWRSTDPLASIEVETDTDELELIDLTHGHIMNVLRRAIYDPAQINYIHTPDLAASDITSDQTAEEASDS